MRPSSHADEVFQHLAGRWALEILIALREQPRRFIDLRRAIPHVSANALTTRLRELEAAHLIRRRPLQPSAAVQVYELGDLGGGLHTALEELARWKSSLFASR
jgi:DNA-binding HxlR family transcriptional regulator